MSDAETRGYAVQLRADAESGWVAEVAELPGCVAAAPSPDEVVARIGDAITAWVEEARAQGRPVPAPWMTDEDYSGRFVLRVPRTLHRRLASEARREQLSLNAYCVYALATAVGFADGVRRSVDLVTFLDAMSDRAAGVDGLEARDSSDHRATVAWWGRGGSRATPHRDAPHGPETWAPLFEWYRLLRAETAQAISDEVARSGRSPWSGAHQWESLTHAAEKGAAESDAGEKARSLHEDDHGRTRPA